MSNRRRKPCCVIATFGSTAGTIAANILWDQGARPARVVRSLGANVAGLDGGTVGRAAVACNRVAVVAGLARIDDAISANPSLGACSAGGRAAVACFDGAETGATIARNRVAVVANLAARRLHNAVTAILDLHAQLAGSRACPAVVALAEEAAAVTRKRVAIVALFSGLDRAVAQILVAATLTQSWPGTGQDQLPRKHFNDARR